MIELVEIADGVIVRIPSCWDVFLFAGVLYVRTTHGWRVAPLPETA